MSTPKKTVRSATPARRPASAKAQEPGPGQSLDFDQIQALVSLVGREPIDEFQLESQGVKLHIRKWVSAPATVVPAPAPSAALPPAAQPTALALAASPETPAEAIEDPGIHHITSPIVGTFYRAPNVSAPPFVQPGDFVKPGQTLCIVEAMKLMNEIECDVAGEVVTVPAENGQPVEYGERLFAIRVR